MILTVFLLAVIAGIACAHFVVITMRLIHCVALFALLIICWRKPTVRVILLAAIAFVIGHIRGTDFVAAQTRYDALFDTTISATTVATTDAVYDSRAQMVFTGRDVTIQGQSKPLVGTVQIAGFGAAAVFAGDIVQVHGKIREPYGTGQASIGFATLQVLRHQPSLILSFRRSFIASIQSTLPEPLAAFGSGLLIGQRSTLPKPVKDTLLAVGLTHIIAVSGYNLTILINAMRRSWLKYSKRINSIAAIVLMVCFVVLTGASASISRAAIVSMISLVAVYYGRTISPFLLLLIAAAITGWITPFYVWGDPSWYLSFLAFAGILLFAPLIIARWKIKNLFAMVLVETVSAELMTIPYILATFGQISLIALPANVLVVALIPFAMVCTAIAAFAGWFLTPLAGWLSWPAHVCLTYMLDIAGILGKIPHAFQKDLLFSASQMLVCYAIVICLYFVMRYHAALRHDKITDITENLQRSPARERSQQMVNN